MLLIYRRLRRSFGRQPLNPIRMWLRVGILLVLGVTLLPLALKQQFLLAVAAGLAAGTALAFWGAQRTRFASADGRLYFVPHTYTGVVVSLLFVGRFVYRFVQVYSMSRADGTAGMTMGGADSAFASPAMVRSPLTVGLIFVLIGYYVAYYGWLLLKSRRLRPEDLEAPPASAAASP